MNMKQGSTEAVRSIGRIAAYAAILIALSLPSIYFALAYQNLCGLVEVDAQVHASYLSRMIGANPDLLPRQTGRLAESLAENLGASKPYRRQILDAQNKIIADNHVALALPLMTRGEVLSAAGKPVGKIQIQATMRPLLINTGLMALSGILLGSLIFLSFRDLPLQTLRRAWRDLAHSKETAELTAQISRAAGSSLETKEIFNTISRMIRNSVPFDQILIANYSHDKNKFQFYFAGSDEIPDHSSETGTLISKAIYRELYEQKKILNIPDITDSPRSNLREAQGEFRAILGVPILQDEECIAHILLASREVAAFSKKHEQLLSSIVSHLGPAIRNANLLRESEERARRLAILNELSREISQNENLKETLDHIARASVDLTGGDKSRIFLYDETAGTFDLYTSYGHPPDEKSLSFQPGSGLVGTVAETGEAVVISDIQKDPRLFDFHWAREHDLHGYIVVPVRSNGKPFVVINCFSRETDFFGEGDLEVLNSLATQIATAIQKTQLLEKTREHASRQEITARVAMAVGSTLEPEELFKTIVKEIQQAVPVDRVIIAKSISSGRYTYYFDDALAGPTPPSTDFEPTGKLSQIVYRTKRPYIIPDLTVSEWQDTRHARLGYRSVLVIPILQDDHCIAHMNLSSIQPGFFTKAHEDLFLSIAGYIGAAIQNSRLHDEARRSRNFFRSVIADNADAIMAVDPNLEIIQWNKGAEKLLGYSEDEALGRNIEMLIPETDREAFKARNLEVFREGRSRHFEAERLRKDGSPVPASITISPVKDEAGKTIAVCTIYKDLTERAESERKLKVALDEAEASSRAKSDFLSTMSHELRSPLNAVIGFSDLIMRDTEEKNELTTQLVPKIRESGKYLLSMIEEILDLDRIETGKAVLKLEPVAINDLVGAVVDSWRARLPAHFSLILDCDPGCGTIQCDSTRIGQIINNLIDNAIKYSPDGGAISVHTLAYAHETRISVTDEGIGIKPEERETIFDRFHQLESGYTRRAGGLGIGLALAQKLISLHRGRIWVEGKEGEGSTFSIALPRGFEATSHLPGREGVEESASKSRDPWDGRKILIVDDMDYYHEYMKILMKSAGLLETASNGKEGIEAAVRFKPDLILMDLRMPIMDGFEAIKRLKSDPETKNIPVLAVTAQAMEEDKEKAFRAGANGIVTKPIDIKIFKEEMERALSAYVS